LWLTIPSQATTLEEWRAAASELDQLEGNNRWKDEPFSSDYNADLIKARLRQLDDARISCDPDRMLFLIRTSLTRNLGEMGNIKMYKHCRVGTKYLIEKYIDSVLETITSLIEQTHVQGDDISSRHALDQIVQTRQSFGRSALLLSGGGTFGMNHIGVVKCLWELKLLPRIISGSSAGSIVCAVLCSRTDDEIPAVLHEFCYGDLEVFSRGDGDGSFVRQVGRLLKIGALFDIGNLIRVMKSIIGDMTFQEAYNRTRRILNICVTSASIYELPKLLNYITAPNVIIWSAVAASCSVPLVFSPANLLAKDPRTGEAFPWNPTSQRWIDGSVEDDLPMTRLAEMFNVNHFIVSQVNPHVVPFLEREDVLGALGSPTSTSTASGWLQIFGSLAKDEAMHRMNVLSELGVLSNLFTKVRAVMNQRYSGDINIFPEIPYTQFPNVLKNPTTDFMLEATLSGERATWPKLSRIRNHCAIELALDDAVQKLRLRIAFSPSQTDLRLNNISRPTSRAGSDGARYRSRHRRSKRVQSAVHLDARYRERFSSMIAMQDKHAMADRAARALSGNGSARSSISKIHEQNLQLPICNIGFPPGKDGASRKSSSSISAASDESESDMDIDAFSDSRFTRVASEPLSPTALHRHLFPHSSQPATPLSSRLPQPLTSHSQSYFAPAIHTPVTSPFATVSAGIRPSGAKSRPEALQRNPSSPADGRAHESRKPLHSVDDRVSNLERKETNVEPAAASITRTLGLKRSLSTGLRGLKPPDQSR